MSAPSPDWMATALDEARRAYARDETPVGAAIVCGGRLLARAGNEMRARNDPTAHAEMLAIRRACRGRKASADAAPTRLSDCDLYVTLEPCPMCAAAIVETRLRRLYYAVSDPEGGGVEGVYGAFASLPSRRRPEVYVGFREVEAAQLMRDFFAAKRRLSKASSPL